MKLVDCWLYLEIEKETIKLIGLLCWCTVIFPLKMKTWKLCIRIITSIQQLGKLFEIILETDLIQNQYVCCNSDSNSIQNKLLLKCYNWRDIKLIPAIIVIILTVCTVWLFGTIDSRDSQTVNWESWEYQRRKF